MDRGLSFTLLLAFVGFLNHVQGIAVDQEYGVNVERGNDVDVLKVTDHSGDVVEVIEVHADQDYQVIQPIKQDQGVCMISHLGKSKDDARSCFNREPWIPETPDEEETAVEKCGDRRIYLLRPTECRERPSESGIVKRECVTQTIPTSVCVRMETYCEKYGWWWGSNRCKSYGQKCVYEVIPQIVKICD